jgi:hypothetical protein
VRKAITDFIVGCKADGIWSAIKASCILMGARTLSGALVPLVGAAPTNNGPFVSGDYNRKTGLVGNGTTKSINTNRAANADPQNDFHFYVYVSTADTVSGGYLGSRTSDLTSRQGVGPFSGSLFFSNRSSPAASGTGSQTGGLGTSRSASTGYSIRRNSQNDTRTVTSVTPDSTKIFVFADSTPTGAAEFSNGRIAFYSIGQSLTLSLLDSRIATLYNAIGAAI